MVRLKKRDVWSADFETTGKANLEKDGYVRVWLWSLARMDGEKEYSGTTMESFLEKVKEEAVKRCFFYNLRFDGSFLVDWLLRHG